MDIAVILGTRPEIIKMSPVIKECERLGLNYFVLHTGQHYSYEMDKVFFDEFELPQPMYNLDVGSGNHVEQTGKMMAGIEKILMIENPNAILIQADTNTVIAGALAASNCISNGGGGALMQQAAGYARRRRIKMQTG